MQETLKKQIAALGQSCGASCIILFGSRARGDKDVYKRQLLGRRKRPSGNA